MATPLTESDTTTRHYLIGAGHVVSFLVVDAGHVYMNLAQEGLLGEWETMSLDEARQIYMAVERRGCDRRWSKPLDGAELEQARLPRPATLGQGAKFRVRSANPEAPSVGLYRTSADAEVVASFHGGKVEPILHAC